MNKQLRNVLFCSALALTLQQVYATETQYHTDGLLQWVAEHAFDFSPIQDVAHKINEEKRVGMGTLETMNVFLRSNKDKLQPAAFFALVCRTRFDKVTNLRFLGQKHAESRSDQEILTMLDQDTPTSNTQLELFAKAHADNLALLPIALKFGDRHAINIALDYAPLKFHLHGYFDQLGDSPTKIYYKNIQKMPEAIRTKNGITADNLVALIGQLNDETLDRNRQQLSDAAKKAMPENNHTLVEYQRVMLPGDNLQELTKLVNGLLEQQGK
ncbi:MAG: hypothetical protein H6679_01265 [Epsilonproteobacteria bacterium]|nr:hypothetical protein [Campylobacterota bacterium]